MRTLVMGSGGIGGYYGALIGRAGHTVTFIARGAHLEAIQASGLRVKSIDDAFELAPARATSEPAEVGPVDLVLFAVKTYDTEAAATAIRSNIGPETVVVTFQNGIESAQRIKAAVGEGEVLSAPTQIETFVAAPGQIEQRSNFRVVSLGESDMARFAQVAELVEVFRRSGFQVNLVPDIRLALWSKFIRLCPVSGLATLARTNPYDLFQLAEGRETLTRAVEEAAAVGRAEGVPLTEQDTAAAVQWGLELKSGIQPSMQKDVARGNRLEIDALSGAVVRLGRKHGLATPVHETIFVGLKPEDERNARSRGG